MPFLTHSQEEPYTYKDKTHKFEVNLPKKPSDVTDKPFRQVTCNQSASLTFHTLVFPAEVKIGKEKFVKTASEVFNGYKNGESYKITGSTEFSIGGVDVIEFWGTLANLKLVGRLFVHEKFVYQFNIYSESDIVKDFSYPYLNSVKLNGVAIQSPDHDPNVYQTFVFDPKKYVAASTAVSEPVSSAVVSGSATKVALVIGIKSYEAVPPLGNTINDARDIANSLKTKGFSVIEVYDPKTKSDLRNAVLEFNKALRNNANGVGMLYYSGHGMQVDGANYMIPAGAKLEIKADIEEQCMNMDYVLRSMEENGNQLNIIVLDACRNNPFRSFSRSAEKGLSMVSAPKGSYIVYATKPGAVASDGSGRNGLFTSKLLKFLDATDQSLEEVFKNVAAEVSHDSKDQQRPWISSDYTGVFYFNKQP